MIAYQKGKTGRELFQQIGTIKVEGTDFHTGEHCSSLQNVFANEYGKDLILSCSIKNEINSKKDIW